MHTDDNPAAGTAKRLAAEAEPLAAEVEPPAAEAEPPAAEAAERLAARLRAICLALPEVTERPSHGAPTWFVRDKKPFVTLWATGHHGNHFPHLWCAGLPGVQEALCGAQREEPRGAQRDEPRGAQREAPSGAAPDQFFRPPYVGHRGWIGVRLDLEVDWTEVRELCTDAYRAVAPATLAARLPDGS